MTPVSIAEPSSVQTPAHRPRPRAALRILGAVALLLAGAMPSEAAARVRGGPAAVKQSTDTVSVTFAAPAGGTVAEGDTAHFEVGVAGDTSAGAVTVQYAVSGTAKPDEDYAEPWRWMASMRTATRCRHARSGGSRSTHPSLPSTARGWSLSPATGAQP